MMNDMDTRAAARLLTLLLGPIPVRWRGYDASIKAVRRDFLVEIAMSDGPEPRNMVVHPDELVRVD